MDSVICLTAAHLKSEVLSAQQLTQKVIYVKKKKGF